MVSTPRSESSSVPDDGPQPRPNDWVTRAFLALALPPLVFGLGIALLYMAAFFAFNNLTGTMQGFGDLSSWWLELVNASIAALLLTANAVGHRAILADLHQLRPLARCSDTEFAELVWAAATPPRSSWISAAAAGLAFGTLLVIFDPVVRSGAEASVRDPVFLWAWLRNVLVSWAVSRTIWVEFVSLRGHSRLSAWLEVDLLDPGRLAPFARNGQRSALVWVLFSVLFSLFWLEDRAGTLNPLLMVYIAGVVTYDFWLPLRQTNRIVVSAKRAELERVNAELRRAIQGEPAPGGHTLSDWAAYHTVISSVREWPISAPGLLRFALYVGLGVGSWLGGALVERLLGVALD